MTTVSAPPHAHSLEIEALRTAARWPNASPRLALVLLGRLTAARRFADASTFFGELAGDRPTSRSYSPPPDSHRPDCRDG